MNRAIGKFIATMLALAVIPAIVLVAPSNVPAADDNRHQRTDVWAIARGGQLYDNWMAVLDKDPPKGTHPAYPAAGKNKGASTWRCKECHGWDYKGAKGTYAKGSHFTGIKGVRSVVGRPPAEIHKIIMDRNHGFTGRHIPHSEMEKLAIFLSRGQVDTERYIDRATAKSNGNHKSGAEAYQTICAVCHGLDGKAINFKTDKKPEFVGTICKKNPWEALHKIRFGQPGAGMVALASLEIRHPIDILNYCQTLPVK